MFKQLVVLVFAFAVAACAIESDTAPVETEQSRELFQRLITITSADDFDAVVARLSAGLEERGLTTFAIVDHAAGAAGIGETLNPSTLFIFGNPLAGTPHMQAQALIGLDLPLKMLVVADDEEGGVTIAYPNMAAIFDDYGLKEKGEALSRIEGALAGLAKEAVGGNE